MKSRHTNKKDNTARPAPKYQLPSPRARVQFPAYERRRMLLSLVIFCTILAPNYSVAQSKPQFQQNGQGYSNGTITSNNSLVRLSLNSVRSNAEVNATGPLIWGKALWKNLGGEALQEAQTLKRISFKVPVQKFTLSGMPREQISIITEIVKTVPPLTMELSSTQIRHLKLQDYLLNGTASFQGKTENFSIPVIIRRLSTNLFTVEGKINASDVFSRSNNFMFANMQGLAKVSLLYEKKS